MVSWYWLLAAFMLGGSFGFLTLGVAMGSSRDGHFNNDYSRTADLKSAARS